MSENHRTRPDKEPDEPDYSESGATIESCFESLVPTLPENAHYIADHDSKKPSNKNDS